MARMPPPPPTARGLAVSILASPRLTAALATVTIGTALLAFVLRQTIGWAGLVAILVGLVGLTMASLAAQWSAIDWRGLLPISLMVFVGWAGVSVFWSQYQWATVAALLYLLAFTLLGIYIALARDTIQIVRAFGDVLRVIIGASLAIEVFSGLLIDTPIRFLSISGNLAELGPIQGLLATRNQFGLVAVIAIVTFVVELLTRSISRTQSVFSLIGSGAALLLTRAPLAFGAALVVAAAAGVAWGLRRAPANVRPYLQVGTLVVTAAVAGLAWLHRIGIVRVFNAGGDLTYRLGIWHRVEAVQQQFQLQGWGWIGIWRDDLVPFLQLSDVPGRVPNSALNGYLDVWFQLGLVGLLIFLGFIGLTFVRSWLLASRRRNIVFVWPALVLVVLLVGATAESSILYEFGWMTLVICCVKASRELSWRRAFSETDDPGNGVDPGGAPAPETSPQR